MANNHADILAQFLLADGDIEIIFLAFFYWRSINSYLNLWLLRKGLTLQRIFEERRIGVVNYLIDVITMYHTVQFHEISGLLNPHLRFVTNKCNLLKKIGSRDRNWCARRRCRKSRV